MESDLNKLAHFKGDLIKNQRFDALGSNSWVGYDCMIKRWINHAPNVVNQFEGRKSSLKAFPICQNKKKETNVKGKLKKIHSQIKDAWLNP